MTCSFCGKHQDEVSYLIIGPGVNICDECVGLCREIISGHIEDLMRRHSAGNLDRLEIIIEGSWFETKTGKEIIKEWLKEHGYSGLYNEDSDCGCPLDDLIPCGEDPCECEAGYKKRTEDGEWIVGPKP